MTRTAHRIDAASDQNIDRIALPALPDRLYKFMETGWARELCHSGRFRVGTLHDLRDTEKYGHGVVDVAERAVRDSNPDQYVYCASLRPSWDAVSNPHYTACVEIFEVKNFISAMHVELARLGVIGQAISYGRVEYIGSEMRTGAGEHSGPPLSAAEIAFLKPDRYESQQEFRIVFEPAVGKSAVLSPVSGINRKIAKCCRFHSARQGSPAHA